MDTNEGFNVRVVPRGDKFIWELLRDGTTKPVSSSDEPRRSEVCSVVGAAKWQAGSCSGIR
jgi:hypothetical protein